MIYKFKSVALIVCFAK